jgi:hypothetical protein
MDQIEANYLGKFTEFAGFCCTSESERNGLILHKLLQTDGTNFRSTALCGLSEIGSAVASECETAAGSQRKAATVDYICSPAV